MSNDKNCFHVRVRPFRTLAALRRELLLNAPSANATTDVAKMAPPTGMTIATSPHESLETFHTRVLSNKVIGPQFVVFDEIACRNFPTPSKKTVAALMSTRRRTEAHIYI